MCMSATPFLALTCVHSVFREIEPDLTRFGGQLLTSMPARCIIIIHSSQIQQLSVH